MKLLFPLLFAIVTQLHADPTQADAPADLTKTDAPADKVVLEKSPIPAFGNTSQYFYEYDYWFKNMAKHKPVSLYKTRDSTYLYQMRHTSRFTLHEQKRGKEKYSIIKFFNRNTTFTHLVEVKKVGDNLMYVLLIDANTMGIPNRGYQFIGLNLNILGG